MIHLRLTLRHLRNSKFYFAINLVGLAVTMLTLICLTLYVSYEFSYDSFHQKKEHLYRVWTLSNNRKLAITPPIWSQHLKAEFDQIENAVTTQPLSFTVLKGNVPIHEDKVFATDSAFFDMFYFPIIDGHQGTFLKGPREIVLSQRTSNRYFKDQNPTGRTLDINLLGRRETFMVIGVLQCPPNAHFQFDFLISDQLVKKYFHSLQYYDRWDVSFVYSYVLLKNGIWSSALEKPLTAFLSRHGGNELVKKFAVHLEPIESIHLESDLLFDSDERGSLSQIRFIIWTAIILLFIAITNFVNLSSAEALKKIKQTSLRKLFGSSRSAVFFQFLAETTAIALIALILAVLALVIVLPTFAQFVDRSLNLSHLLNIRLAILISSIPLTAGALAGLYPASLLMHKGLAPGLAAEKSMNQRGMSIRKILLIVQFAMTACLMIATISVQQQVNHMRARDLGFDHKNVIAVNDNGVISTDVNKIQRLKNALDQISQVESMAVSSNFPGEHVGSGSYIPEGYTADNRLSLPSFFTDHNFVTTYGIKIVEGRDLKEHLASDSSAFLINETARDLFGSVDPTWLTSPIGKKIAYPSLGKEGPVVGIFEDFHFRSLHHQIGPLIITLHPTRIFVIQMKLAPHEQEATIAKISALWHELFPEIPFDYQFVDQNFDAKYGAEDRLGQLFLIASYLSIVLALFGLFTLTSFLAQEKEKEFAIRKVIGASHFQLMLLMARKFNQLVLLGSVLAFSWPHGH